jgi:hypothetical protein
MHLAPMSTMGLKQREAHTVLIRVTSTRPTLGAEESAALCGSAARPATALSTDAAQLASVAHDDASTHVDASTLLSDRLQLQLQTTTPVTQPPSRSSSTPSIYRWRSP